MMAMWAHHSSLIRKAVSHDAACVDAKCMQHWHAGLKSSKELADYMAAYPYVCIDPVHVTLNSKADNQALFDKQLLHNNYSMENQVRLLFACLPAMYIYMYVECYLLCVKHQRYYFVWGSVSVHWAFCCMHHRFV